MSWLGRWFGRWFGESTEVVTVPVIPPVIGPPFTDLTSRGEAVLMIPSGLVSRSHATGMASTDTIRPRLFRSADAVESRGGHGSAIDASPVCITQPIQLVQTATADVTDASPTSVAEMENYV